MELCVAVNIVQPVNSAISLNAVSSHFTNSLCYILLLFFAGNKPLEKERVVVCYVAAWAHLRQGLGKFTVDDIAPTLCTHLVYAFAVLDITKNSIGSMSSEYDLEDKNGAGWWLLRIVF
jgi:hypothetical protein